MKKAGLFCITMIVMFSFVGCTTLSTAPQQITFAEKTDAAYLSEYFGIAEFTQDVDAKAFDAAMLKVVGEDVVDENDFNVIKVMIDATALTKLAATYTDAKASARLVKAGIEGVSGDDAKYLACALDANLLLPAAAKELIETGALDSDMATYLLMNIAQANGSARNYIGNTSDANILQKISEVFDGFSLYSDGNLDAIGARAVQDKASTGYNLKIDSEDAKFLPSLTIQYGHSDEVHLKQLVVLLASEGIDAKMQIEPKVSIYEYLLDWGPIPEPSPFYMVEKFSDDLYLVHAVEYDTKFEFATGEDLKKFDTIINTYAKKNEENQKEGSKVKLIQGAWWQPLYSASFNPDESSYKEIVDCVLAEAGYSIHPFSVKENSNALSTKLENLSGIPVQQKPLYVNNAFYRYITGEDFQ
ncbi:hypothetical protein SpiGrapes_0253 [Sphaerochaeta pleomorpha str. Grapes]|uniref:Uncharacterized protein n=1 Tax=Sphaerochaeta pleomorpha (strain ATCC BAA-1885 / DSM 22778 / Grapes) TaxID=158190 RepID=G8QUU0_SPHPG|nr:hypothetical protein [Sphaerochaeta pleomorpha]AEV28116.1 hypothetical protein SpiGrapes_0253 [Sphaerochaeta pleomorpha str. Grapes]